MDLKRFFSDTIDWNNKTASLTGEEYYHAVKVTRHKKGYKLILCGGDCYDYFCEVTEVTKDALYAKIESRSENNAESDCFITLFIGVNKELDTVVQKAVEMGVKKIVPFTSAHSNVDKINIDRLKKIVVESSKQCGRNYLAEVTNIVTLNEAFELSQNSTVFFYYEYEKKLKTKDVKNENGQIGVFIGSEGGFSTDEVELARNKGANVLTLGNRILRVSTAVVSALSLIAENNGEI